MRRTGKRIISLICALSMILMTLGNISFAADYTADDIKGMLDPFVGVDVNLDNWATYRAEINAVVEAEATLSEDEEVAFEALETANGVKYSDILHALELVVTTGPVYDGIQALPKDEYDMTTGGWIEGVNKDNYQTYYEIIIDLGVLVDALTTEQQRLLGETNLARYATAAEELAFYWFDYVSQVVSALVNVNTSNDSWADMAAADKLNNYQTKRAQYEKAVEKVNGLYVTDEDVYEPDQLADVNTALKEEENIEKTAQEILDEAKAYIDGIYTESMEAINTVKGEIEAMLPITIDNCADINVKAVDGLEKYEALKTAIGANYWDALKDDALEAALIGYRDESSDWIDSKAFVDAVAELKADVEEGITKDNYSAIADKYDTYLAKYDGLSDAEKALAPTVTAKAELDTLKATIDTFAAEWVAAVETAINAIGDFDYATYKNVADWTAIGEKITAADTAVLEIRQKAEDLYNTLDAAVLAKLTDAKTEKATIEADYTAAIAVENLITVLGTVGNLPEDAITLESKEDIEAARVAYDALTDVQKALVENYANLETAENEYAQLDAQKTLIEGYVADFNTAKELVTYTDYAAKADADTAYNNAVAIADDAATYGTKLAGLVTTLKADKEVLDAFVAAIEDLKTKGDALVAAVDAICAKVDIKDESDLEGRLEAYAISEDAIAEMNELFAAAGEAFAAYNSSVANSESHYGVVPVESEPYATYVAYKAYYEAANDVWNILNPAEQVAAVDEWIEKVNVLFDEVDSACVADLTEAVARYGALVEEYDNFESIAQRYLYSNYMSELSKYDYIGIRIGQYLDAADIIDTANNVVIPELPADYDGTTVDFAAYKAGVTEYEAALNTASQDIIDAFNKYNNSDNPTKEIPGVNEAYEVIQTKESVCTVRKAALTFDKKVILAADSFASELAAAHYSYEAVIALKDELAAIAADVLEAVTSENLLADVEADAVEDLIVAIGTFDITNIIDDRDAVSTKITAARNAYDILTDDQKAKVENYAALEAAELLLSQIDAAIAFINAVNALEVVDATNCEAVKAAAAALRAEYDGFDDTTKGLVANAYITLQKKQAEVVSFMLSLIPGVETIRAYQIPADMNEIDKVIEMLYAIDHVDANGNKAGAYRELTNYSKLIVVGYANYGVAIEELKGKLAAYNTFKAEEVIGKIDEIGYYDNDNNETMTYSNYASYKDAIEAAEEANTAYEVEIAEYQNVFGALATYSLPYLVTNKTTMDEARADYDKFAAAEARALPVNEKLEAFFVAYPNTDAVTNENYKKVFEAIEEIEVAYGELDSLAKKFVDINGLSPYFEVASMIERYMSVVEAIDALIYDENGNTTSVYDDIVNNAAFDAEYGLIISDLEALFNDLTPAEKAKVTNYAILDTARTEYDKNVAAAIEKTMDAIDAIYEVAALEEFAKTNAALETALIEANDWYNSLSAENQALVENADKLQAANEKFASLTEPNDVIAAIDELGDPEEAEITDSNYMELTAKVAAVRELYDSLANADKLVVDNYTYLTVWEEKLAAFEPDHSGDVTDDGVVSVDDISMIVDHILRRSALTAEQFERANLVVDEGEQVIDIFDILAAIELIVF